MTILPIDVSQSIFALETALKRWRKSLQGKGRVMRVQIYEEELGEGVELIEPADDDRSAVTIWCREKDKLRQLVFGCCLALVDKE